MTVQLIRMVHTRQPQQVAAIESKFGAPRLVWCPSISLTRNIAISAQGTLTNAQTIGANSGGIFSKTGAGYIDFPGSFADISTPITFVWVGCADASLSRTGSLIFSSAGSTNSGIVFGFSSTKIRINWPNGGGTFENSHTISPNANDIICVSASYEPVGGQLNTAFANLTTGAFSTATQTYAYTNWGAGTGAWRLGHPSGIGWGYEGSQMMAVAWLKHRRLSELVLLARNPWQIFAPQTIPLFFSTVTAQYARPTSDVSAGTWTASSGSDLFAMLDETVANDADYIVTTGASTCEVALGALSDPSSSAGHIVRYRISATSGGITVRLRQGTTTIATWTHASAPTSLTTYEQTLTGGEADSISDYSALRLQFEATT